MRFANVILFPAHAGVILILEIVGNGSVAFPRPRGGDPDGHWTNPKGVNFSPPTRG